MVSLSFCCCQTNGRYLQTHSYLPTVPLERWEIRFREVQACSSSVCLLVTQHNRTHAGCVQYVAAKPMHILMLVHAVGSYSEGRGLIQGQPAPNAGDDSEPNKKYWFLNIRRYRRFFNVDTDVSPLIACTPCLTIILTG